LILPKRRLKLWDISDDQIRSLEEGGEAKKTLTLYSPFHRVCSRKKNGLSRDECNARHVSLQTGRSLDCMADCGIFMSMNFPLSMWANKPLSSYPTSQGRPLPERQSISNPALDPKYSNGQGGGLEISKCSRKGLNRRCMPMCEIQDSLRPENWWSRKERSSIPVSADGDH